MKNLFIIMFLALFSTNAYSQIIPVSKVVDTTQLTLNHVYNDLKDGIIGISSALKVGATHVYEILVRQQRIYSIIGLIGIGLTIYLLFLCLYYLKHGNFSTSEEYVNTWDFKATKCVVYGILSLGFLIASCIYFNDTITGFYNPEYGAMKDIINFTK